MHLNSELYDGIETVEFLISDLRQKYFFPELPKLRNKLIRRIEIAGSMHTTPSGYTVETDMANAMLTLVNNGVEIIKEYLLGNLNITASLGRNSEIFNHLFDLSKSYIFVSDPSVLTIGQGFIVAIYYQDPKKIRYVKDLPAFKIDYVEAPVLNLTDTKIKISNFRNVQDKRILYIASFNTSGGTYYSPDGRQIVAVSYVLGSYLNLWDEKEEIIKNLPLGRLFNTYARREQLFLRGLKFDWDNSYIQIPDPSGLTVGHVYYLPVFYID